MEINQNKFQLHTNPIFLQSKESKRVLQKDEEVSLENGDRFAFLPENKFCYELKFVEENEAQSTTTSFIRVRRTQELNEMENLNVELPTTSGVVESTAQVTSSEENVRKRSFPEETEAEQTEASKRPRIETNEDSTVSAENPENASKEPDTTTTTNSTVSNENAESENRPPESENLPIPSSSSASNTDPVVVKKEPNTEPSSSTSSTNPPSENPSTTTVKTEPGVKTEPVTCNGTASADNSSSNCSTNHSASNDGSNPNNVRESCQFGIRCYRRTQEHRTEFAHPGDSDYRRPDFPPASPNAPPCPFGAGCYRRNPQHFQEFQHPPPSKYPIKFSLTIYSFVSSALTNCEIILKGKYYP